MNGFDSLLNTAIIGTDKLPLNTDALPVEIKNAVEHKKADGDELVLHAAALLCAYNNAGKLPSKLEDNRFDKITETKKAVSPEVMQVLQNIETTGYYEKEYLCNLWLDKLIAKKEIVQPEFIMPLINTGISFNKATKLKITQVIGVTGKLILPLKPEFKYNPIAADTENGWKEGNAADRRLYIEELLTTNNNAALTLIKNDWNTESITFKKSLIEILIQTPANEFLFFLETLYNAEFAFLANEKTTVTQCRYLLAKALLNNTKSSLYTTAKQQISQYAAADKKGFLEKIISGSKKIKINLPAQNDSFFNPENLKAIYGIEPKNNNPAYFKTDIQFWFSELLAIIPLTVWMDIFEVNEKVVLEYFLTNENHFTTINGEKESIYLNAIHENLTYCKNQKLILELLHLPITIPNYGLAANLSASNFEAFALSNNLFLDWNYLYHYPKENSEWPAALSNKIVTESYNEIVTKQTFINDGLKQNMAKHIHSDTQKTLDNLFLKNDNNSPKDNWVNDIYKPIKKAIEIKQKINQY